MENPSLKNFIINYLIYTLEAEKKISAQRDKLTQIFCFDTKFGYFKYIDKNKKNYINYDDISNFLHLYKIKCTPSQLKQIIKNYDKDLDHCWNFDEYTNFIQNKSSISISNFYAQNPIANSEISTIICNYEKELSELFKYEIEYLEYSGIKIKNIKQLSTNHIKVNAQMVYEMIKGDKDEINMNVMYAFINNSNSGYSISLEESKRIIKRISNGEKNGVITYKKIDEVFKYDKYIQEKDTMYIGKREHYKLVNPIDNSNSLFFAAYAANRREKNIASDSNEKYFQVNSFK